MARPRALYKRLMINGTRSDFYADRAALMLLDPREQAKAKGEALRFAIEKWAHKYLTALFSDYIRSTRGYNLEGGRDRRPLYDHGHARAQVLAKSDFTVTNSPSTGGSKARIRLAFPQYVTRGIVGQMMRRAIEQMPPNEVFFLKGQYERRLQEVLNGTVTAKRVAGRQRLMTRGA